MAQVRYTYPLPGLYRALEAILGWTFAGSAEPITDVRDVNCEGVKEVNSHDLICVGVGK